MNKESVVYNRILFIQEKNEILSFAAKWEELEGIMLIKLIKLARQTQKD